MASIWDMIATSIEMFAELGAGFQSLGLSYEPEMPDELKERM